MKRHRAAIAAIAAAIAILLPLPAAHAATGGWTVSGTPQATAHGSFTDLTTTHPFYADIMWLKTKGIANGWSDGTFRPNEPVDRDAFAAFLYRLAGSPAYTPTGQSFADVPRTHPFFREIEWAATVGIVRGWNDGTYRPNQPITRDAIATMLNRYVCSQTGVKAFAPGFTDVPSTSEHYWAIGWAREAGIVTGWPDNTYRPGQPTERGAVAAMLHRLDDHTTRNTLKTAPQCTVQPTKATLTAPTRNDPAGNQNDTLTLPQIPGVVWTVDGTTRAAGTHKTTALKGNYTGTVTATVKATLQAGYAWAATPAVTQWSFTWTNPQTTTGNTWPIDLYASTLKGTATANANPTASDFPGRGPFTLSNGVTATYAGRHMVGSPNLYLYEAAPYGGYFLWYKDSSGRIQSASLGNGLLYANDSGNSFAQLKAAFRL